MIDHSKLVILVGYLDNVLPRNMQLLLILLRRIHRDPLAPIANGNYTTILMTVIPHGL